MQVIDTWSRTK